MIDLDASGTRITAWANNRNRWYTPRTAALTPVSRGMSERALRRMCQSEDIEAVRDERGQWHIHGECLPGGAYYPQQEWQGVAS